MTRLRTLINNHNNRLKIIAIICGYNLWLVYSNSLTTTVTLPLPLFVYNIPDQKQITFPDSINVTLRGTYQDLRSLDDQIGFHIDAATLPEGKNSLSVAKTSLVLPRTLSVLHCNPSFIEVSVINQSFDTSSFAKAA